MGKARSRATSAGVTFDAGALIALDRADKRMIALLDQILRRGQRIRVPAGVVAQAWRDGKRQATLARFLRGREVEIVALDEPFSRACGELCASAGSADVIDASVVITARKHGDLVVTSDPDDLRKLAPRVPIVRI
jgi:ABC-type thiamine transport system ATPase subunit